MFFVHAGLRSGLASSGSIDHLQFCSIEIEPSRPRHTIDLISCSMRFLEIE